MTEVVRVEQAPTPVEPVAVFTELAQVALDSAGVQPRMEGDSVIRKIDKADYAWYSSDDHLHLTETVNTTDGTREYTYEEHLDAEGFRVHTYTWSAYGDSIRHQISMLMGPLLTDKPTITVDEARPLERRMGILGEAHGAVMPDERLTDPYDLALLSVTQPEDLKDFTTIEHRLESPAERLLSRDETQAGADGLVQAAQAYADKGYFMKASALKRKAAAAYVKVEQLEVAGWELVDAISLIRQADMLRKLKHEREGLHLRQDVIRATYPDLHADFAYRRGEVGVPSGDGTILKQMQYAYVELIKVMYALGEDPASVHTNAERDMHEVHPKMTREWQMRGKVFKPTLTDWVTQPLRY